jgi:hypothetical protein
LAGVAITFTRKVRTAQPLGTEPLPKLTAMKIGRGWDHNPVLSNKPPRWSTKLPARQ